MANKTGQSTESTVKLYARLARSTEELSLSQSELFTITEAINQSFIVSGATATEAASATLQLSQGLAAGALRGEELNSVMENSPRLARALAEGMGVGIGQLREMGKAGEITAEKVTTALLRTAGTIEGEFNAMPMTVGRVMQTLANDVNDALGRVDTGQLIDGVEELRKVISDPATVSAISSVAGALIGMVAAGAEALGTMVNLTKFISEEFAAAIHGIAIDDVPRLEGALFDAQKRLKFFTDQGQVAGSTVAGIRKEITALEKKLKTAASLTKDYEARNKKLADSNEEVAKTYNKATIAIEGGAAQLIKSNEVIDEASAMLDKMNRKSLDLIDTMKFEIEQLSLNGREQAINNALRQAGAHTTQAQRNEIAKLAGALYDESEAMKTVTAEAKEAEKAIDPFGAALVATAERIDGAFAEAWKGAFDSFSSFADSLKDAFKNLLAELAHMAITRPIVMSITGALGLGGSATASAASGGIGGLSSLGSIYSGGKALLAGGIGGIGSSIYSGLSGLGSTGGAFASSLYNTGNSFMTSGIVGQGTQTLGMGTAIGAGVNIGAGFAGNYVGSQVFDQSKYSGAGGTVGSIAGAIVGGPIGAAIGAFIGNGLGSLFGREKADLTSNTLDFAMGTNVRSRNRGHDFDEDVAALGDIFLALGQVVGATGSSTVGIHGDDGFRFTPAGGGARQGFGQDFESFFDAVFDDMVKSSDTLSDSLKSLLVGFEGSVEQTGLFAESLISVSEIIKTNAVDDAIQFFADSQEAAGNTILDSYNLQISAISDLVAGYDGSAEATSQLNAALIQNKSAAFQMALGIEAISEQLTGVFSDTAQYIRDSLLTSEQLQDARRAERAALSESLETMVDPEAIQETALKINELTRQIFDNLAEGGQEELGESFAKFAEKTDEIAQRQLDVALESTRQSQEDVNAMVSEMLATAAQRQQSAADTQLSAANDFGAWVKYLVDNGITLNIGNGSEVSA